MLCLTPFLFFVYSSTVRCLVLPRADDVPYYTLEEHWTSPALQNFSRQNPIFGKLGFGSLGPLLGKVGPNRIASMDANNIQIQIISHVPVPEAMFLPNLTSLANNQLASRVAAYPDRFRGFCILPMGLPSEAAAELKRCVQTHGFVGALVDSYLNNGLFYDGSAYDVLWAAATDLNVPIYLHPTTPDPGEVFSTGSGMYAPAEPGEYSDYDAVSLATWAWGWHERTGMSFIKLYLGGAFDRFPKLQIILGHMGELVPYYLARTDDVLSVNRTLTFRKAYGCNVCVTTSGMFSLDPMATLLRVTDGKRIMYSVDWPFSSNENGTEFMETLRSSGMVSEEGFEDIAFMNAKRLLRL